MRSKTGRLEDRKGGRAQRRPWREDRPLLSYPPLVPPFLRSILVLATSALLTGCGASQVAPTRSDELPSRAPVDTRRLLLSPVEIALLRDSDAPSQDALVLGRASQDSAVLLMRFVSTWRDDAEVTSAFVLLSRSDDARPPRRPLAIEVSRILDPWRTSTVSWGRQPRTSLPEGSMTLTPRVAEVLRVDVTSIVRAWSTRRPDDRGIAVRASGDDPFGWQYALGVTEGRGPVLEVYVR